MAERTYTIQQIADAIGVSKKSAHVRAGKDGWPFQEAKGLGGRRRLFPIATLPPAIQKQITAWEMRHAGQIQNQRLLQDLEAKAAEDRARAEAKAIKGEQALAALAEQLTPGQRARFDGRHAIVQGWELFFVQVQPMKRKAGMQLFADEYNEKRLPPLAPITDAVRQAYPTISARSLERWYGAYQKEGLAGLIDGKDGKKLKDLNVFTRQPLLYNATLAILIKKPTIKTSDLTESLKFAAVDHETGEQLFEAPSYWATSRFINNWKETHPELYLAATNPDAWKNRCMAAVGSASEDVTELNQRWEMDATPADWMLIDPETGHRRRYTVSAVIDVFSRRMLFVLSRTPRAQTHMFALRLALLAWGVPQEIVTDNGKDYLANEFVMALEGLGIEHHITGPFSPWEKPHVERGIGTMLHSVLEMLPNFLGHNVAERKAIESRKAFSERLFKKGGEVEIDMPPTELQQHIDDWLTGIYHQRAHRETGETPFQRAANWTRAIRRIQDERALDMLLAPLMRRQPTLQKKGLQIENGWYASVELFDQVEVGTKVSVRQTEDFGTVMVYQEGRFIGPAICPERKGIGRKELALATKAAQTKRVASEKRRLKQASRIDPDQIARGMLRQSAIDAGKLAVMPARGDVVHQSEGLSEAVKAADRMANGKSSRLDPALQRALDERQAERQADQADQQSKQTEPTNVRAIPETAEQRYWKWKGLEAQLDDGEAIADAKLLKWFGMYPQSSEFQAMKRRHEKAGERRPGTVTAMRPANNY